MRRPVSPWILALLTLLWMGSAEAATIFTNFVQPGYQYGPDPVGFGAVPVPGLFLSSATNFTPVSTALLLGLELPLAVVSGPAEIDVLLLADAGNIPGSVIESFHLTGFPVAGPTAVTTIPSSLQPQLNAGTQYWVAVTGGTPTTFGMWGLTLFAGDPSAGGASRAINNGQDGGWIRNGGTRVGALQVNGDDGVPEPGSMLLIGTGLAALAALRRTRRRI